MKYLLSILLFVFTDPLLAQDFSAYSKKSVKQFELAKTHYQSLNYQQAIETLDNLLLKEPGFLEAYLLKADVLHEMKLTENEIACLEELLAIDSLKYPKAFYTLGITSLEDGRYKKARKALLSFIEVAGNKQGLVANARKKIQQCEYAIKLLEQPVEFDVQKLDSTVNSEYDEYWPSISLDGEILVFTRLLPFKTANDERQFYQEDFFISEKKNGVWTESHPVQSINTMNNEGAQAISPDAKMLFFTACSQRDSWGGCDIYFSRNIAGEWSSPVNVGKPVNSRSWEAQPSVSANNEYVYFASNRGGGKGGMDIWRCRIVSVTGSKIQWGVAENLGDSINTPGNEMSPFIHPDGQTLYFASDYWPGLGGNDIFFSKQNNENWTTPKNIGYPINTYHDEQGLIADAKGEQAYYSSNRDGKGLDIFRFTLPEQAKPTPVTYAKGKVFNIENKLPLEANIELIELCDSCNVTRLTANEQGNFLSGLMVGKTYLMNVSMPGFLFYSENFALNDLKTSYNPFLLDIPLQPIKTGSVTVLKNIFFETGSFKLKEESMIELNKLLFFLKQNPSVKIEIGGHTDNVGTEEYNQKLSENRAKEVYHFLVENNVLSSRLKHQGYGFSQPVADNISETGKAKNRRTEIKIIE